MAVSMHMVTSAADYLLCLVQMLPILIGGVVWLIVAFIIQTGSKNKTWKDYPGAYRGKQAAMCFAPHPGCCCCCCWVCWLTESPGLTQQCPTSSCRQVFCMGRLRVRCRRCPAGAGAGHADPEEED